MSNTNRATIGFGWRLPFKLRENVERIEALNVLDAYLFRTTVAPFNKAFINIKEPLASTVRLGVQSDLRIMIGKLFCSWATHWWTTLHSKRELRGPHFYKFTM